MALSLSAVALDVSSRRIFVTGDRQEVIVTLLMDSSYPTGGYPFASVLFPNALEITSVVTTTPTVANVVAPLTTANYDRTNDKLMLTGTVTAGVEAVSTFNAATYRVQVKVVGKGLIGLF